MTIDPDAIIEAAARALCDARNMPWEQSTPGSQKFYLDLALSVVPVVAPLIRAAALEEAAQVAEEYRKWDDRQFLPSDPILAGDRIAAAIRALKEQP